MTIRRRLTLYYSATILGIVTVALILMALALWSAVGDGVQATGEETGEEGKPILPEIDPEMERLLAEEEEIERRTREHHETPHMRKETD